MLATPTRRLRATTGLPQKPFNEEYIWLMGDSAVEAKAGDGENVGYAGSGDEALREGGRRHPISLMFKSRLQKLVDRTDDECVSSHIFTGRHVLIPIPSVDGLSLGKPSGLPKDTSVPPRQRQRSLRL